MTRLSSSWSMPTRTDADLASRDHFDAVVVGPALDIVAIEEEWMAPA